jgi:hypothetical protein
MKKFICISLISFLLLSTNSFSQTINLSADSISTLLCKKWEVDYAMMGNMKIGRIPGATEINYEFNKDKTFLMTSNDPKDTKKGTWAYDTKKKIIKLTVNGKSNTSIISLKEGEFIILADTKEATPDDPMEIKVVYKIKTK